MAIYEITSDSLRRIEQTSFAEAGIKERSDLQRLLRTQVDVISPDTLVIYEEFGDWQESKRRIDLLGIDKNPNLVVIELKRNEDGGHMELQAIRYSAMVSAMTFDKAVEVYSDYLNKSGQETDARQSMLEFLDWEEPDEDLFAQDVRMVLVSAEFSKELTTAVMWLNDRDLDIRCIRMKPYSDNGRLLVDVQQVIPLPEAATYQVQIREKERKGKKDKAERNTNLKRFWTQLLSYARSKSDLHANISPAESSWVGAGSGVRGLGFNYVVAKHEARVEIYIDRGANNDEENKTIFNQLHLHKDEIEEQFGGPLEWQRLDGKRACRIKKAIVLGGYRTDESQWQPIFQSMVDAMIALEKAIGPHIAAIKTSLKL